MSTPARTEFGEKAGLTLNRIVALLTALAALAAGLAPVVADLDWESTVGIVGGLSAVTAVVYKWLDGWQKWEGRHDSSVPVDPAMLQPALPPESAGPIPPT
jgi:cyanate permease